MLSFGQKLVLSSLAILILFLVLLDPSTAKMVDVVVYHTLSERTKQVIEKVSSARDEAALIQQLKGEEAFLFFRVSLIRSDGFILFDSHREEETTDQDSASYLKSHSELGQALAEGVGYSEAYSELLHRHMVYVARAFPFQGKMLIMRTSFPLDQIDDLKDAFEIGFFIFGILVLILFGIMVTLIIYRLSRPIRKIIEEIQPYQKGIQDKLPHIDLGRKSHQKDDFQALADTLNSMGQRIEKQLEEMRVARNEKEATLDSLVEGVVTVDDHLNITYANRQAIEILSSSSQAMMANKLSALGFKEFQELLVDCQQQKEMLAMDFQVGDKKKIFLDVLAIPKGKGAVLVLQDKSIHYRLLEMRKDFIANASHELKTPITIVKGFAETLRDNVDMPREMIVNISDKLVRNCERMESLVKNFLRLADIEKLSRSHLKPVNVIEIIDQCRSTTLAVYPDATIDVVNLAPGEVICQADEELLQHAIGNLFDNAAKYSQGPAKITTTVEITLAGDQVKISVADQGIGIPQEDIERIFDRFYTVDKAHSRRLGGSGLGLSIVRTIVEKHFGKITVTSTLGKGSTFTIYLPLTLEDD